MAKLRQEMKDLIEKKKACFVLTADKNGKTNISPKGSLYGEINRSQRKGGESLQRHYCLGSHAGCPNGIG